MSERINCVNCKKEFGVSWEDVSTMYCLECEKILKMEKNTEENKKSSRPKIAEKLGFLEFNYGTVKDLKELLSNFKDEDIIENYGWDTSYEIIRYREETDEEYQLRINK